MKTGADEKRRGGWLVARHIDGRLSVDNVMVDEWREMHKVGAALSGFTEQFEAIEKMANEARVTRLTRAAQEARARIGEFLEVLAGAPSLEELERIEVWAGKCLPFPFRRTPTA
jgi:hypothetical protein